MSIQNRPYAGNWSPDFKNVYRKVVSWTPDAIVRINGETTVNGCRECNNVIDFQAFITSANVSAALDSLSGDINLSIPKHYGDSIFKDGAFMFNLGAEVHIYYRGYFVTDNLSDTNAQPLADNTENFDLSRVEMRPYYPVFHGVVTGITYNYGGGFYSASLSLGSLLTFWEHQKINTQAAYLAASPTESRGSVRLDGHVYTDMTPHQIIYDLYRDSAGAAEGLSFAWSSKDNIRSKSASGEDMYSLSLRYWEKRFAQGLYDLRMYGVNGRLYSATEQAFLSNIYKGKAQDTEILSVVKASLNPSQNSKNSKLFARAAAVGLVAKTESGNTTRNAGLQQLAQASEKDTIGVVASELKAFITDLGAFGNISLFDTSYESKKDIAQKVAEAVGYEFYQDLDGDLVFKPPMYNLDTSTSRIYQILPEDITDISFSQSEPACTYVVCKGGPFRNLNGTDMQGEWGIRSTYVDYRLVARFGWRAAEFETTFYNTREQAFYAAVVYLDTQNRDMFNCSITIPLRPELKMGYPIYVEHIDTYYYLTAISHSFAFGSSCTSSLTLGARRKKFLPPGDPREKYGGNISQAVDLGRTFLPPRSLYRAKGEKTLTSGIKPSTNQGGVYVDPTLTSTDADIERGRRGRISNTQTGYDSISSGPITDPLGWREGDPSLRTTGFPNVVMALDTTKMDPAYLYFPVEYQAAGAANEQTATLYRNMLILEGYRLGALRLKNPSPGGAASPLEGQQFSNGSIEDVFFKGPWILTVPADNSTAATEYEISLEGNTGRFNGEDAVRSANQELANSRKSAATAAKKGKHTESIEERARAKETYEKAIQKLRGDPNTITIVELIDIIRKIAQDSGAGLPQPGSTGALINLLSDKKASFNPNQPGYYRYYSSSHPIAAHQAPDEIRVEPNGNGSATVSLQPVNLERVDATNNNMVMSSVSGTDIVYFDNTIPPTRGFRTKTLYSSDFEVTPTKDILTLSFHKHSAGSTSPSYRSTSINPTKATLSNFRNAFSRNMAKWIKKQIGTSGLNVSALKTKLFNPGGGVTTSNLKIIVGNFYQGGAIMQDSAIINDSNYVAIAASTVARTMIAATGDFPDINGGDTAKVPDALKNLSLELKKGYKVGVFYSAEGGVNFGGQVTGTNQQSFITPIFPISDENGYEVFGSYQYGRGLDISPNGSFDQLLKQDPTRNFTEDELDAYLKDLYRQRDPLNANQILAGKAADRILNGEQDPERVNSIATGIGLKDVRNRDQFITGLSNAITNKTNEQAVANIPARLAEIRPATRADTAVCNCRGHDDDVRTVLFTLKRAGYSLEVGYASDEEEVLGNYSELIRDKSGPWSAHQEALMGREDTSVLTNPVEPAPSVQDLGGQDIKSFSEFTTAVKSVYEETLGLSSDNVSEANRRYQELNRLSYKERIKKNQSGE